MKKQTEDWILLADKKMNATKKVKRERRGHLAGMAQ
jgi:hypothetical protein